MGTINYFHNDKEIVIFFGGEFSDGNIQEYYLFEYKKKFNNNKTNQFIEYKTMENKISNDEYIFSDYQNFYNLNLNTEQNTNDTFLACNFNYQGNLFMFNSQLLELLVENK